MAKKLLLADDSVTIQKVVGISFASEDVTLITVDNGEDAIIKAQECRPDAILADVVMPGKSGYEVCEAIKADPALQHIPVLLLTGTFESFDEQRAQRCGAAGHVAKPFEAQALVERVLGLFAQASAPPPAPEPTAAPAVPEPSEAAAPASTPERAPAASSGESFDFFDDDLGDLTPAEPAAAAADAARRETDPLDSDGAFAFASEAPQPEPFASPEPAPAAPLDRTLAILEDEGEAGLDVLPSAPTELDASLEPAASATRDEDLLQAELAGPAEAAAPPADDFFDFEIGGSAAEAGSDAAPAGRSADLAEATVLDPKGASGYDVSSSDLGDPLSAGLFGEAPASEDSLAAPIFGEPLETASQQAVPATPLPAPEAVATPEPDWAAEPFAAPGPAAAPEAVATPEPDWAAEPFAAPGPAAAPEPIATPEPVWPPEPATPAFEAAAGQTPAEAVAAAAELDESSLEDLMPPAAARPAQEPQPRASAHDAEARVAATLEQIKPRLREQLHDTLEKIAWESFGDVTEQIVRTALERVEQIAWEVIPQMAETLIREEIRRMKRGG